MAQYTDHYNLTKPSGSENALISDINANMDILDDAIYDASQHGFIPADIINLVYPVGSIITLANNADPNNIYQGTTWQKIEGKFLLGSSSDYALGSTGGEAEHTLTINEMPSHSHSTTSENYGLQFRANITAGPNIGLFSGSDGHNTGNTGGGQAHNNMPPYEVVNYWKRTA